MKKPYLNKAGVDEVLNEASKMVPLPESAYVGPDIPRGLLLVNHILNTHDMSKNNKERLQTLNEEYFRKLRNSSRKFHNKERVHYAGISEWTHGPYQQIQRARRGGYAPKRVVDNALTTNYVLAKYFRETDVRSPYKPVGFENTRFLYRKVILSDIPGVGKMLKTGVFHDKGFMAFTRNLKFAKRWFAENSEKSTNYNSNNSRNTTVSAGTGNKRKRNANNSNNNYNGPRYGEVIFRLRIIDDIPPGVPWLWFSKNGDNFSGIYRSLVNDFINGNTNKEDIPCETVLPPGYLILKNNIPVKNGFDTIFDVSYMPDIHAKSILHNAPIHSKSLFAHIRHAHDNVKARLSERGRPRTRIR